MNKAVQKEPAPDQSPSPGSEVDRWILRFEAGPLSADEARAFNAWLLADPAHEQAFDAGKEAFARMDFGRNDPRSADWIRPSPYERVFEALDEIRKGGAPAALARPLRLAGPVLASAALAAIVIVAILLMATPSGLFAPSPEAVASLEPDFTTETGEIRAERLPDGSVMTLGARSAVSVQFTGHMRQITLLAGEAFFEVEKRPDRPFIVAANGALVRVLGTKFDVSLGDNLVDVAVAEGRVEVIRTEGAIETIVDRDIMHVLTAGQRVTSLTSGPVQPVDAVRVEDVAAWRQGELVWLDTPMRDIISDLNRYTDDRIILEDTALGTASYTFSFQADEIAEAIDVIADSLSVEIVRRDNGDVVLR